MAEQVTTVNDQFAPSKAMPPTGIQMPPAPRNQTLLQVKTNTMLDAEAKAREQEANAVDQPSPMTMLASFIENRFRDAERARMVTQTEDMMDQLRRRKGVYSPERLADIKKQGGSEIFIKITEAKCLSVEALLEEVVNPEGDRPWSLKPRNKPKLPPEAIQQIVDETMRMIEGIELEVPMEQVAAIARQIREKLIKKLKDEANHKASNMADLIEDQFSEGGFGDAMEDVICDIVTVGTGIMKGPFVQMDRTLAWAEGWVPDVQDIPMLNWKRVEPLHFFPSAGATDCDKAFATYLSEVDEFTRTTLVGMKGTPGWSDDNIDKVLAENKNGTRAFVYTDPERAILENRRTDELTNPDDKFQGVWYCGEAYGTSLADWGIKGVEPEQVHEIIALKLGNYVVHCRINADPLGRRPYKKAVYKPIRGSFWGEGVPRLMDDIQDNCNAAGRHVINALAIGSGPQVIINDMSRMSEGQDLTSIYPWKIWQCNDPQKTGSKAVEFFLPQTAVEELWQVFDKSLAQADERIGLPQLAREDIPATSLSIIINQTSRVIKRSIRYIDRGIIKPNVRDTFTWNMIHIPDESIKGDCEIVAAGAMGLFVKEQQQLRTHDLLAATANPTDASIMGRAGRAALIRSSIDGRPVDPDDVVPTQEEIEQQDEEAKRAAAAQPPAGQPGQPAPAQPPQPAQV